MITEPALSGSWVMICSVVTGMPSEVRASVVGERVESVPSMVTPRARSSRARPDMPQPPIPIMKHDPFAAASESNPMLSGVFGTARERIGKVAVIS